MGLRDKLYRILNEYKEVYDEIWKTNIFTNPLLNYFNSDFKNEVIQIVGHKNNSLLVDSSTGVGKTTKTPWLAIMDGRITTKASKGTYIVYLFNKDEQTVYLTLEQSINEAKENAASIGFKGRSLAEKTNQLLEDEKRRVLNIISTGDFKTDKKIFTGKEDFDITAIAYKKYEMNTLPTDEDLKDDLFKMIDIYCQYYDKCYITEKKAEPLKATENLCEKGVFPKMNQLELVDNIYNYILMSGFSYSSEIIKNLYLSLKSKPFVILAGISGTGKSNIVKLFAEAIGATTDNGQYKLIPVRPDWSDSTDLLGHMNLDGKFIPGSVTEFLAEANKPENLEKPFILCLDEMNLARVEYYFSDFLSVMETRSMCSDGRIISEKLLPKSVFGSDEYAMKNYGGLYLSENVYIVGTVNMDETTFPFSKKVLDRANTIEFSDIDLSLGKQTPESESVMSISVNNEYLKCTYMNFTDCYAANADSIDKVIMLLDSINSALKVIGAQVAYRVRDEISYYVTYAQKFELLSFDEAMDNAFSQKILPRIQGSSLSLRGVFRDLFRIMANSSKFEDNELLDQIEDYMKHSATICRFPKSAQKVVFMLRRFEEDGYTSYWL
jgi:energy-coupling factor transporter ATP-binding protein EcfA2